jgi:RNA polymerase primary sigma factor
VSDEGIEEVAAFLAQLGRLPRLRHQDQLALARRARSGCRASRERMIRANIPLVVSVVGRYRRGGASYADLLQDGFVGLIQAVDRFDPERGLRFSTYATYWIDHAARAAVRDAGTVRLPQAAFGAYLHLKHSQEAFAASYGRAPTLSELAGETGLEEHEIDALLRAAARHPVSLDAPADERDHPSHSWATTLADPARQTDELVADKLQRQALRELIAGFAEEDQERLHRHFRTYNPSNAGARVDALLDVLRAHPELETIAP